ncbi:MAG: Rid family hydrolase, partial [Acidobacteriota bacterium]
IVQPQQRSADMLPSAVPPRSLAPFIHLAAALSIAAGGYAAGQQAAAPPLPVKRVIQPAGYKPSAAPLVPAILVGDTLYLSGSTGGDPATTQLVTGGFEAEMKQIMSNVQRVLGEAGMSLTDVVTVTAYLADMGDYATFNDLYRSYFPDGRYPARSTVAVRDLARGARLELTMTAVRSR